MTNLENLKTLYKEKIVSYAQKRNDVAEKELQKKRSKAKKYGEACKKLDSEGNPLYKSEASKQSYVEKEMLQSELIDALIRDENSLRVLEAEVKSLEFELECEKLLRQKP